MRHIPSTLGATVAINVQLFVAVGCVWAGRAIWPTSAEWWGLGFLSIVLGLAALGAVADALKLMIRVYRHQRAILDYLAQGKPPSDADVASGDQLDRAGMR